MNTSGYGRLQWDVLISKKRPGLTSGVPPGNEDLMWVTNSATLIYGERDAVLVDTFLTIEQSNELVEWVVASGKNVTTIYVTHAHGDHFFGAGMLLDRFPNAKVLATPEVCAAMLGQIAPDYLDSFWKARFPDQIPSHLVGAQALDGTEMELEGHELVVVKLGHTDTDDSTCLYVPSIGLVVAGDAVYNGIHLYQGETNKNNRQQWIAALARIDALDPRAVVPGHNVPGGDTSPNAVAQTRDYLYDFMRLEQSTANARELYDRMLELYPDRANPGSLWGAVVRSESFSAPVPRFR